MALTKDLTFRWLAGNDHARLTLRAPLATTARVYLGSIVGFNASGYLVTADAAAAAKGLGVAICGADNSTGIDGEVETDVLWHGVVDLAAGALTRSNVGSPIYASDDNTLTAVSNDKLLGTMLDIVDGNRARIKVG